MGAHDIAYNLGGKFEERQVGLATGPLKYFVGGSGPALVHLHGGGGLRVSSALQTLTETFTVYMPVTPGFDGTAFHDQVNSFPELAEVMWRFVDDVVGAPCDISGHAFGGRLALWLAALHGPKLGQFIVQCPSGFRDGDSNELDPKAYAKALVTFPD
ncbi:MAG: alpha/beta hydrolase, partial [Rhodospirillaceae bacterium]